MLDAVYSGGSKQEDHSLGTSSSRSFGLFVIAAKGFVREQRSNCVVTGGWELEAVLTSVK